MSRVIGCAVDLGTDACAKGYQAAINRAQKEKTVSDASVTQLESAIDMLEAVKPSWFDDKVPFLPPSESALLPPCPFVQRLTRPAHLPWYAGPRRPMHPGLAHY
jgi:hypothetical protein